MIYRSSLISFLVLLTFLLAMLFNLDGSRSYWGLQGVPIVKYFFVLTSFFLIVLLYRYLFYSKIIFLFLFLFMFMLIGGLIGYLERGSLENTYIGRSFFAIYMLSGYLFSVYVFENKKENLLNKCFEIIFYFSFVMAVISLIGSITGVYIFGANYDQQTVQAYHAILFIIVVLPFYINNFFYKCVFLLFVSSVFFFSGKTTSIIVLIFLVFYYIYPVFLRLYRKINEQEKFFVIISIVSFILMFFIILFLVVGERLVLEADKGVGGSVRLISADYLLGVFLQSPIWGNFFTGNPIIEFSPVFSAPSHLDFFEFLAYGGGLYAGCFALLVFYPIKIIFDKKIILWSLIAYSGLLSTIFNPVLATPRIAFIIFFSLGVVIAYSCVRRKRRC